MPRAGALDPQERVLSSMRERIQVRARAGARDKEDEAERALRTRRTVSQGQRRPLGAEAAASTPAHLSGHMQLGGTGCQW